MRNSITVVSLPPGNQVYYFIFRVSTTEERFVDIKVSNIQKTIKFSRGKPFVWKLTRVPGTEDTIVKIINPFDHDAVLLLQYPKYLNPIPKVEYSELTDRYILVRDHEQDSENHCGSEQESEKSCDSEQDSENNYDNEQNSEQKWELVI